MRFVARGPSREGLHVYHTFGVAEVGTRLGWSSYNVLKRYHNNNHDERTFLVVSVIRRGPHGSKYWLKLPSHHVALTVTTLQWIRFPGLVDLTIPSRLCW